MIDVIQNKFMIGVMVFILFLTYLSALQVKNFEVNNDYNNMIVSQ